MNYNYITKEEVSVTYFQFPKFLLKYPISQNGKVVYMLLYDRARLSQMNNWLDENGWIYVIYPITELIKHIGKCRSSIKSALKELEEAGLLVRRSGGFSKPNHLYIKIPTEEIYQKVSDSTQLENGRSYNQPLYGQNTGHMRVKKSAPNKVIINKNNISNNKLNYECQEGESL